MSRERAELQTEILRIFNDACRKGNLETVEEMLNSHKDIIKDNINKP
jgi:hypothetical protein